MILNSTQIPNKILEAIFNQEFTPLEIRVLLFICRKTIGWQKELDKMTIRSIARALKSQRTHINTAIKSLVEKKAIIQDGKYKIYVFSLNETRWGIEKCNGIGNSSVTESGTESVTERAHTKDTITKDTITKDIEGPPNIDFFENPLLQEETVKYLVNKEIPQELAKAEINKFIGYWTELSKNGRQVRWQGEKYFDVRRRLGTWFKNINKFNKIKSNKFSFN